ncbi:ABC transporter permease [Paenibacillus monticola]|uniref:ABC transporter permease subunit n=1 Tax=Paenibacillus monticola TaxID=2666075 RepID=A0A7X2H9I9_9BACL|nr:ABC transporter permease subunit [Paenibacillus monticola]MRN56039.1 ABC transporter permease subunit [Paenibacillus monticola]
MRTNSTAAVYEPLQVWKGDTLGRRFRKQLPFQIFVWLGLAFLLVFNYAPMFGVLIAFKNYKILTGISGIFTSEWVGLRYFRELVRDYNFPNLVRNTLALSVLKLVFSFPVPIILAIMLTETRSAFMRRFVQTASYLPHFISWVIVSGMAYAFFSTETGMINNALMSLHIIQEPIKILTDPNSFWGLAVASAIWKEAGWWTIIFLASISGIDPTQYEAAEMDGAGRLQRIWHVTLPGMKSAYAAATDLIQSVIAVILVVSANTIAKKVSGSSLY